MRFGQLIPSHYTAALVESLISLYRPSGGCDTWLPRKQPARDAQVEKVPADAVDERGPVGAGEVEDRAGQPAAERHAEERRRKHDGDPRAGFAWREELAHDDWICRDVPALDRPEQGPPY